ncbi:hypothetical protein MUN84_10600 [Hymenobacter sp. 5516J-16]|uniref:hypothetical protein n=1 Tax=Hymenobacter sp. 5516J-16 TaxID=2932253 RepID=UPI001FD3F0DB|nr:hypothetical protein [Hymenobacter sp. 5516J-16]UOQ78925.1 hypothetical protein MUN84_10600 [Hymenobacter sp. 5516J-16]
MLSVEEATRLVTATVRSLSVEYLSLPLAAGRVLREDLCADRDFPPFNRVAMDGIALRFAALEAGQTEFRIDSTQFAGQPPQPLHDPQAAVEIMTGAALPVGVDTVIRYEDLTFRTDAAGQRYATVQAHPHARATTCTPKPPTAAGATCWCPLAPAWSRPK